MGLGIREASHLIQSKQLDLKSGGVSIPWLRAGFGGSPAVVFYGEGTESIYTRDRIYQLGLGRGKSMASVAAFPAGSRRRHRKDRSATPGRSFLETSHLEEDQVPLLVVEMDDPSDFWFWDHVTDDGTRKSFDLDVEGVVPGGQAMLTVQLKGATKLGAGGHHFRVWVNGQEVGDRRFHGFELRRFAFPLDPFLLKEGRNSVELAGISEPDVPYSVLFIDAFDVEYERYYAAYEDELLAGNEGHELMTFSGFSGPNLLLLDVSDPKDTKLVRGAHVEQTPAGSYQVTFGPSAEDARYLAVTRSGIRQPFSIDIDHPSNLSDTGNRADYLLVTTAELVPIAERLALHRANQGFESLVIDIDDIMDEFNDGELNPQAIRWFLTHAYSQWQVPPRYVVLLGEGTIDYKDIWGLGNNLIPPLMLGGPGGLYASDNRLADLEGDDGVPEVAIGRIPVETAEQLTAFIDKIVEYDLSTEGEWLHEVLLVADNPDETGDYPSDSEVLAGLLPEGYRANRIYLSDMSTDEAFENLVANLNRGVSLMTYLGHAGLTQLANEGLLRSGDVSELTNAERLPVVVVMGCYLGNFYLPGYPSLAEDLVLHGEGGAAAVWAPVALSYNPQRRLLGEAFLQTIFQEGTDVLGDAVIQALRATAKKLGASHRELLDSQVLLGDPALRLKGVNLQKR